MRKTIIFILFLSMTTFLCTSCTKESILDAFKEMNESIGDHILTDELELKGTRKFGVDHYTGTYQVSFYDFHGTEILFGGTTIKRDHGDMIHIKLVIENSNGKIEVSMKLKENKQLLAEGDGIYEYDFNVKDGSNYLMIKGASYTGKVSVVIE